MDNGDIDLVDAYAVETPDDNRDLYARWAKTYESGFITDNAYRYHIGVAGAFLAAATVDDGPVMDVGCGTGLVGEALRADTRCPELLSGLDLSPEMIEKARSKRTPGGEAVYSDIYLADLTGLLPIADNVYGGITSCGTFTHGHVGPDALDELYRIARPGALFAVGINPDHFIAHGFAERFDKDVAAGKITKPTINRVPTYGAGPNVEQRSPVVVFRLSTSFLTD
ncbi:MAG: class I SAM-dependent methyltransferase [Acidimicrobiales bacterium]|nr:class I SAM-dependent methyltransferase [Acidimicrobiales bacterium]